jgi:hypothetical protein
MSTTTMEEFDYDRRLQAYERMDASIFAQFNRSTGLLVLSQAVFDMGSEDMSLGHSSSSCLQSFVKFASSLLGKESPDDSQGEKADEVHEDVELALDAADGELVSEPLEYSLMYLAFTIRWSQDQSNHWCRGFYSHMFVMRWALNFLL